VKRGEKDLQKEFEEEKKPGQSSGSMCGASIEGGRRVLPAHRRGKEGGSREGGPMTAASNGKGRRHDSGGGSIQF